jgi:alpha-D-ribose 1-methylphosphonate 5-triphosphate diphosphatase
MREQYAAKNRHRILTIAKVSANQADMLGLNDRGEISIGKRADLIRVRVFERLPIIMAVWRNGISVR